MILTDAILVLTIVIGGDTLRVRLGGHETFVRVSGNDTPETTESHISGSVSWRRSAFAISSAAASRRRWVLVERVVHRRRPAR